MRNWLPLVISGTAAAAVLAVGYVDSDGVTLTGVFTWFAAVVGLQVLCWVPVARRPPVPKHTAVLWTLIWVSSAVLTLVAAYDSDESAPIGLGLVYVIALCYTVAVGASASGRPRTPRHPPPPPPPPPAG